ncbi:alpha/beta-hydrolase [Rhizoclosmatium globosum]|uniref:Alpha/beta-hydrolase n=1 Tax=Rhizoclosmatium globosum TaxID=329046 RepID=A0A1Y2CSR6_9FUNG|nr:alpha/beta-hydrolase [Rhizoclosmatium globosum]|eukprot:ORY50079.1 alpha/beta-hydrolase [Rhizoclosmatium globosum]
MFNLMSMLFASPRSVLPEYFPHVPQAPLPSDLLWIVAHACPFPLFLIITLLYLLYIFVEVVITIAFGIPGPRPSWSITTRIIHAVVKAMTTAIPLQSRHSYTVMRMASALSIPAWLCSAYVEDIDISMDNNILWDQVWQCVTADSNMEPHNTCRIRKYSDKSMIKGEWVIHWDVEVKLKEESHLAIFLHGGYAGSRKSHRHLVANISKSINGPVLVIEYTLAPEAMFPVSLFQSIQTYQTLVETSLSVPCSAAFFTNPTSSSPFKPSQITIMGDSSGGCLALETLLLLPRLNIPTPNSGVLLSPNTDIRMIENPSMHLNFESDLLSFDRTGYGFSKSEYAGPEFPDTHPILSPCFQTDFSGVPRLLIQVGDAEVLMDDSLYLFGAIAKSKRGPSVELQIWKDCFHVWQMFPGGVGQEAIDEIGKFVKGRAVGLVLDTFTRFLHGSDEMLKLSKEESRRRGFESAI